MTPELLTNAIKDALTDQAKEFVNTEGESWKKFIKSYAKDLGEQAWIVKTADSEDTRKQARENLEWMRLDAEAQMSQAGLALVGEHSGAILKNLLGLAGRLALGLLIA